MNNQLSGAWLKQLSAAEDSCSVDDDHVIEAIEPRKYNQLRTRFEIGELMPSVRPCAIIKLINSYLERLEDIRRNALAGDYRRAIKSSDRLLRSFTGRMVAVTATVVAGRYEGMPDFDFLYKDLVDRANELNCFSRLRGDMCLHRRRKDNGQHRIIVNHSGNVRAAGRLVSDVLLAFMPPSSNNFMAPGKGRAAAAIEIKQAIQDGYSSWLVLDIANFYPSMKPEHLKGQPLPRQVLHNVAFANRTLPIRGCNKSIFTEAVRAGLPAGATPSPILASGFIEGLLREHIGDHRAIVYGDDVAIYARSPDGMDKIAQALQTGLETNPSGSLQLKTIDIFKAETGFDFLGYRFQGNAAKGCNVSLAERSYDRFRMRLFDRLDAIPTASFDAKMDIALKYATDWSSAHLPVKSSSIIALAEQRAQEAVGDHGTIAESTHLPKLDHLIGLTHLPRLSRKPRRTGPY